MKKSLALGAALCACAIAMGGGKPLVNVPKYDGKFVWVKVGALPSESAKTLASAKSILLDVSFPRDVKMKNDKSGYPWFTFVVADQGSDFKWHQTTGGAVMPVAGGVIRAGKYTVSVSVTGIPKSVLSDKTQIISVGPGTSGISGPCSFSIDRIRGR